MKIKFSDKLIPYAAGAAFLLSTAPAFAAFSLNADGNTYSTYGTVINVTSSQNVTINTTFGSEGYVYNINVDGSSVNGPYPPGPGWDDGAFGCSAAESYNCAYAVAPTNGNSLGKQLNASHPSGEAVGPGQYIWFDQTHASAGGHTCVNDHESECLAANSADGGGYFYVNVCPTGTTNPYCLLNPNPSSSLFFPHAPNDANTTSTPYPNWNGNWVTNKQHLTPLITYYDRVEYQLLESTNPDQPLGDFRTYTDVSSLVVNNTSTLEWDFPKTHTLVPNFPGDTLATTTYRWRISYAFADNLHFNSPIASTTVIAYFRYFAPKPTSTNPFADRLGPFESTSTYQQFTNSITARFVLPGGECENPDATSTLWSFQGIKCAVLSFTNNAIQFTGNTAADAVTYLYNNALNKLAPVKIIGELNQAIINAENAAVPDVSVGFPDPLHPGQMFGVFISSSTQDELMNQTGWDYKYWLDIAMYMATAIIVLAGCGFLIKTLISHNNQRLGL